MARHLFSHMVAPSYEVFLDVKLVSSASVLLLLRWANGGTFQWIPLCSIHLMNHLVSSIFGSYLKKLAPKFPRRIWSWFVGPFGLVKTASVSFFLTFVLFPRLYGNCAIILKAEPAMEQREKQRQFHDAIILKAERAMEQLKKREARVAPKVRETMLTLEEQIKLWFIPRCSSSSWSSPTLRMSRSNPKLQKVYSGTLESWPANPATKIAFLAEPTTGKNISFMHCFCCRFQCNHFRNHSSYLLLLL